MTIPTIKVEIQFSGTTWTDVSQWLVKSADVTRGSSRIESPVIRYEAGHGTIRLDNRDRRFDPTNLSGPYVSGGVSLVTSMRPIRLTATWNAISYPLFKGFIDEFGIDWTSTVYSEATVPFTDGFKVLASKRRPQTVVLSYDPDGKQISTTVVYGNGEDTGNRITRILDSANWSVADRVIAVGDSTLQATELSGNPLTELQDAAESEIGELYVDALGRVVFRNRHAILLDSRSTTVQATFGSANPSPIDVSLSTDDATMWNEATITRKSGLVQIVEDSTSVALNQYKTFDKSSILLEDDLTARNYGQWVVYISKDPEIRFDKLVVFPRGNPSVLFPQILGREIGDRIRVIRQPPGGGSPISRDVFIRGINHQISQENWVTAWSLQSASRYTANFFVLDSATNGVLGTNILSY